MFELNFSANEWETRVFYLIKDTGFFTRIVVCVVGVIGDVVLVIIIIF